MATSFTAVMRDYFGYRPEGQRAKGEDGKELSGLADFSGELKLLTPNDRKEIAGRFRDMGIACDDPS